ncbi:MAG: aminoacyl-tRNA hydrolase [Gemmatimonadetes bacterium]|nr:aminoacyl-tRNA hydrolase [Gemmatimonadota bacterium]NNM06826.1 aminoacyl-tRNA hydrolase [Gemmatimonadota bacterium]
MKVVIGLGNPGPEYDATRHNVGWWLLDRLAYEWDLPVFEREGRALVTEGSRNEEVFRIMKPTTFMNRSGQALSGLADLSGFLPEKDLLIVVDDAALDVGRVRFRPQGSPGGHKGLKSVSRALGSDEYGRLRIGVGVPTGNEELSDWVLSPMSEGDEDVILGLLPELVRGVEVWGIEGMETAMNNFNR